MGATRGAGTDYPSGASSLRFLVGFVLLDLSFMCMFFRSLLVLLYFFFAIVLFVLLRFTDYDILPLVSSNYSYK